MEIGMVDPTESYEIEAEDPCRSVKTIDEDVWRTAHQAHRRRRTQHKAWKMRAVKQVSIAVLLATAIFWPLATQFHLVTRVLIALGALAVAFQAINTGSYGFAVLFAATTLLYNPFVPLFGFSGVPSLILVLASTVPFALSLTRMKTTLAERDRMSGTEGI
jgi:hypothetical protein